MLCFPGLRPVTEEVQPGGVSGGQVLSKGPLVPA